MQFLPAADALDREAITEAVRTEVEGVPTRVMKAEHLVAIALRTGRAKDYARIVQFIEQGAVNTNGLKAILDRHGLTQRWQQFERKYILG